MLVSLACDLIKPLIRAVPLAQSVADGTATTTLVPTGLLTLHAQAIGRSSMDLRPGQPGSVHAAAVSGPGSFGIDLTPATWALLITLWLIPPALCTTYALHHTFTTQKPGTPAHRHRTQTITE